MSAQYTNVLIDIGGTVARVKTRGAHSIDLTMMSESVNGETSYAPAESCSAPYMTREQAQELVKALELAIDAVTPNHQPPAKFDPTAKGY